jgi:two-component system, NarL family, invasion response regulator UvrY
LSTSKNHGSFARKGIVQHKGMQMIRIVLIDDHALVRTGLRMIIEKQLDIDVIGEAEGGEQGISLIKRMQPDVALVDVHMPGVSGVEVTERVRRAKLPTQIVILTMAGDSPFPRRLLDAGASGYVTKGCPADELLKAIRQVHAGRRFLSNHIAQLLALDARPSGTSPFESLSSRELEVAMMLTQGCGMQHIARKLNLSAKTIATYKYRLFEKLNVDNVVTLAHVAALHGLADASAQTNLR